ncbi:anaphase-promoting complex subunit [Thraustotheca clavata]|uniref:Anaphase-promoting complex subunit 2 n=1 Tax=Thraustotheca clavata TaxID=74557 RepID=A0A1W0AAI9_9STRA|nr:anaphase-promoting complex subunit [Thraustotheca clavata]
MSSLEALESLAAFPFHSQRMLLECQTQIFREHTADNFWARFCDTGVAAALEYVVQTIRNLEEVATFLQATTTHDRPIISMLKAHLRAILFHNPHQAQAFGVALEELCMLLVSTGEAVDDLTMSGLRGQLQYLEWIQLTQPSILKVFLRQIDAKIDEMCRNEYTQPYLENILVWVESTMVPRAMEIFCPTQAAMPYAEILSTHASHAFGLLRIEELFMMVKEYPDSSPAIADLTNCLAKTHQHRELISSFRRALKTRLLQPGVGTSSIIDLYTRTIKTFRILDDGGILLEGVSDVINEYLKKRKDTVRCIVASLTDDEHGDLFEELERDGLIDTTAESEDDQEDNPELWQPDPIEASANKTARSRVHDDILSILVNIYGTKELFVNEYRLMLADRLLVNQDYNTDRDLRTLELLKLRFGDESLLQCDIMVKDIEESKRIQSNISSIVDATIVSQHFWPPFQAEEFSLHPRLQKIIDDYRKSYHVLKNPRTLEWVPSLGFVNLCLELNSCEVEFSCTQIQATILSYFEDEETWKLPNLANKLELDEFATKRHADFWIYQGVFVFDELKNELALNNNYEPKTLSTSPSDNEPIDSLVSSDLQSEKDIEVLHSYIIGMLSNYASLPVQRIHTMLTTFARSGPKPYEKTIAELTQILRTMVSSGQVEYIGGQYQLQR